MILDSDGNFAEVMMSAVRHSRPGKASIVSGPVRHAAKSVSARKQ
jgi:hypothetical protein